LRYGPANHRIPHIELKNTTDDAIAPYLTKLPKPYNFVADNTKSNVRLLLGYSAVTLAGVAFYIDYKYGWEATLPWILPAVVVYFALNGALTLWIWLVEAGQVFEGTRAGGEKVRSGLDWLDFYWKRDAQVEILTVYSASYDLQYEKAFADLFAPDQLHITLG
jgi:hypothetical protein